MSVRCVIVGMVLLGGCRDVSPVAPRRIVATDPNYTCSNVPMRPTAGFRMLIAAPVDVDTTGVYQNRYLVPHRSTDTVSTVTLRIIFHGAVGPDSASYCVTLYDSLAHHMAGVRGYVAAP